jgi:hypothetical protein
MNGKRRKRVGACDPTGFFRSVEVKDIKRVIYQHAVYVPLG